jgi:hypothetical protein
VRIDLPEWIPDEPEHLRELLIELCWVRYRSVWKLRDRPLSIPRLVETALAACPSANPHSQYELMRALFNEHVLPMLDDADRKLVDPYFNMTGRHNGSPKQRRTNVGLRFFQQIYDVFRSPNVGAERQLLVRLATAIHTVAVSAARKSKAGNDAIPLPYVERKGLQAEFTNLLASAGRPLVIEGDAASALCNAMNTPCPAQLNLTQSGSR